MNEETNRGVDGIRVLIDGYWWTNGPPSGRNVLRSLVDAWASGFPGDRVVLALPAAEADAEVPSGVRRLQLHSPQHAVATMFELGARGAGADVILSQNFTPLRSRAIRASYVHDVMFQEHPEWFTTGERAYFSLVPATARFADIIATSSESERDRIARRNPRLAGRIVSTGLAVSAGFARATSERPPGVPEPGRFLLTVGRLNVRKNVERLAAALESRNVIGPEYPLVVVGVADGKAADSPEFDAAIARGSVLPLGFVPDGGLKWLYEHCAAFVFPSLDEGFGLPVLEAASCGAPIALSSIPAFREFGEVGSFFDPLDEDSIADAVRSETERENPRPASWVDRYSWHAAVATIREAALREHDTRRGRRERLAHAATTDR